VLDVINYRVMVFTFAFITKSPFRLLVHVYIQFATRMIYEYVRVNFVGFTTIFTLISELRSVSIFMQIYRQYHVVLYGEYNAKDYSAIIVKRAVHSTGTIICLRNAAKTVNLYTERYANPPKYQEIFLL